MSADHRDGAHSVIQYTERQLIQRAIIQARPERGHVPVPRWTVVKQLFCCGSTVATALCWKYGFDPDQMICGLTEDEG